MQNLHRSRLPLELEDVLEFDLSVGFLYIIDASATEPLQRSLVHVRIGGDDVGEDPQLH